MKDNFSDKSELYAKFRPSLPIELFDYLIEMVPARENAWDSATGNGQSAYLISNFFKNVYATDISEEQLKNAAQSENIHYSKQSAEQTDFEDNFFYLIIVSQAIHWFDFDRFFNEAKRVLKPNGILAVAGYDLPRLSPEINLIIDNLYKEILDGFWDDERQHIDTHYQNIPFPFEEIKIPDFHIRDEWQPEHLIGYLNTWSGLKHFIREKGFNPVEELESEIQKAWGNSKLQKVTFPVFTRIGRI
ncbi:MAG: class I SAM-dependent methyltransferase [Flavobacteriaceae bacterium]|nr:class I SAM-dependent methyltransferase [Flavobacteriaceae bacterium]